VTACACSMRRSGVFNSRYALSSWEMSAGWCCHGMRRGMYGNSIVPIGLVGLVVGTLGDGVAGDCWFGTLGVGSVYGVIFLNIAANSFIACILSGPGCLNGVAGAGFRSVWVRSDAAILALSALDMAGTLQCWGKNSTVSTIRSCSVIEQNTRWQR
jgi:hypothetical protein